jgi:hypothetical protein
MSVLFQPMMTNSETAVSRGAPTLLSRPHDHRAGGHAPFGTHQRYAAAIQRPVVVVHGEQQLVADPALDVLANHLEPQGEHHARLAIPGQIIEVDTSVGPLRLARLVNRA